MSQPNQGTSQHILIDDATMISIKITTPNSPPRLIRILPRSGNTATSNGVTNGHAQQSHQHQNGMVLDDDTSSSSDDEDSLSDSDTTDDAPINILPEPIGQRGRQHRSIINVYNRGNGPVNINFGSCTATRHTPSVQTTSSPLVQTPPTPLPSGEPSTEQIMAATTFARDLNRDAQGQTGNTLGESFAAPAPTAAPLRLAINRHTRTNVVTTPSNPGNSQSENTSQGSDQMSTDYDLETGVRSKLRSLQEEIDKFSELYEILEKLAVSFESLRWISDVHRDTVPSNVEPNATTNGGAQENANTNTQNQIGSGVASSQNGSSEHQATQTNSSIDDSPQDNASEDASSSGGI